jgi:hypothetical protein
MKLNPRREFHATQRLLTHRDYLVLRRVARENWRRMKGGKLRETSPRAEAVLSGSK